MASQLVAALLFLSVILRANWPVIIKNSGTGFVVCDGDGAGLSEAILELARNPKLAAEQGSRARRLFETKYEFAHAVAAWESLIRETSGAIKPIQANHRRAFKA